MNKLSKYVLLLLVSVLAACGSDDDAAATFTPVTPQPGDALAVTITASDFVTDGDPDTRATDKGPVTTFEDGDSVGIIILDKDKNPLYNNIPYKYVSSSQKWVAADTEKGACYYDPQAYTYIVYYPYSAKADDCKNEIDLKAIFKPQTNQRDKEAYRASDLMVKTITSDAPLKSLTASLTHAYASVSLSPITQYILDDRAEPKNTCTSPSLKISDVNFTIGDAFYVPYQATDGSLRCILPAEFTTGNIRCFYTVGSKTYGNEINITTVEANKRYISAPEITYSLDDAKVGDFYCKNTKNEGYLIPGDVALTDDQKNACVGIVFWVGDATAKDHTLQSDHEDCTHGLVVALRDAVEGTTVWQNPSSSVQNWLNNNQTTVSYLSVASGYGSSDPLNNIQGYNNTKAIEEFNLANSGNLVQAVSKVADYRTIAKAPANSSDWYLPSAKELTLLCGKDVNDIWGNHSGTGTDGTANKVLINGKLNSISSVATEILSAYYWSSTERSLNAFFVYFDNGYVYGYDKHDAYRLRCVLAF